MDRPIAYDVTHLVSRLRSAVVSGIERVDLAYGRHFAASPRMPCAVHYGLFKPHTLSPARVQEIVRRLDRRSCDLGEAEQNGQWSELYRWVTDQETARPRGSGDLGPHTPSKRPLDLQHSPRRRAFALVRGNERQRAAAPVGEAPSLRRLAAWAAQAKLRVLHERSRPVPQAAVYLNVGQAGLEHPMFFTWLDGRPDVLPVFFIHDLLPLDYPEYFPAGTEAIFARRLATVLRYARGVVTTSQDVARRVRATFAAAGR